jgi:hypothetical protein
MVRTIQGRAHVASVAVFETVDDDWAGKILDLETDQITGQRFATREEALNWVKVTACDMFGPMNFASIRMRKGSTRYEAACWQPEWMYVQRKAKRRSVA